jgi:hypothetical protein
MSAHTVTALLLAGSLVALPVAGQTAAGQASPPSAGDVKREDGSQMYLQPFVTHTWTSRATLTLSSETAGLSARSGALIT